jgi:hypothetical protein
MVAKMTHEEFVTKLHLLGADVHRRMHDTNQGSAWIERRQPFGVAKYLAVLKLGGYSAVGIEEMSDSRYYHVLSRQDIIDAVISANATAGQTVTDAPKLYTWV